MTGGVVFRVADALFFLPATVANKVLPMPIVTHVPGAPHELVGVALVEGETVPVVAVGVLERRGSRRANSDRPRADNRPMLLCDYLGERVGLVGLEIVATGSFEVAGGSPSDHVMHVGVRVSPFDVAAVVDRLREGRWAV
jgi:chemotaxis signal transduction protein